MYKLHLILKYLRKRRIAWVSLVAVTLCTAMVLVVISIMGGWLNMFLSTGHALAGDVVISSHSASGFAHYQEILDALAKDPKVQAAVPVLRSFGVVTFLPGDADRQYQVDVSVVAYGNLNDVGQVNSFTKSLYRQYQEPAEEIQNDPHLSAAEKENRIAELAANPPSFDKPLDPQEYRDLLPGLNGKDTSTLPGIIVGTPMILQKDEKGHYDRGWYEPDGTRIHSPFIYKAWVNLLVGDISTADSGTPSVTRNTYWIVDDSTTGFYPVDSATVYVPFDSLQKSLGMTQRPYQQKVGDQLVNFVDPARVSEIQVRLKNSDGKNLMDGRDEVDSVVSGITSQYPTFTEPLRVETWDQKQAQYIDAIVHEKVLMTFLFGIISIVSVFLVFCIFFMIVAEKTRDIGIIKSVGATNGGVAAIFLGYGLAIGLIGAGMGLLIAYLIIHNINELHAWLSRRMGVTIWDPRTYIFNSIPNTMQAHDVAWIVSVAILSALAGALVPAIRAARMNPVEALRWE